MKSYIHVASIAILSIFPLGAMKASVPIQRLAGAGDKIAIEAWIKEKQNEINQPDVPGGRTALYYAASKGQEEIVKMLLQGGADPNIPFAKDNTTALLMAAKRGEIEIVKSLISDEIIIADVTARDNNGNTVLHMAVQADPVGGAEIIETLLKSMPDEINSIINRKNNEKMTPLQLAIEKKALKSINALKEIPDIRISPQNQERIDRISGVKALHSKESL